MLSIVIITKNEEEYLPKLLESIKQQTFKDYEIIVSDASSTDKTREIAKKYNCKIVEGGMPSKGRNNGAKAAKYDLILFLDSDVVLPENFLEENLKEFKEKNIDCAGIINKPITNKKIDKAMYSVANALIRSSQYISPHAGGPCILCKKQVFNNINGFNEKLVLCEDHDFVYRTKKAGHKFRVLKSKPIFVSIRRLEKEGRAKLSAKYTYSTIYRLLYKDIDKDIYKYEFSHKKTSK